MITQIVNKTLIPYSTESHLNSIKRRCSHIRVCRNKKAYYDFTITTRCKGRCS